MYKIYIMNDVHIKTGIKIRSNKYKQWKQII